MMPPWLFNVYMDGVVREVNVRVPGKGLELLSANGGRFEINQLLFAAGGIGQQRNDSGGCASMRERSERAESTIVYKN